MIVSLAVRADEGALSRVVHVVPLVRRLRPEGGLADVAVYHKAPVVHLFGDVHISRLLSFTYMCVTM